MCCPNIVSEPKRWVHEDESSKFNCSQAQPISELLIRKLWSEASVDDGLGTQVSSLPPIIRNPKMLPKNTFAGNYDSDQSISGDCYRLNFSIITSVLFRAFYFINLTLNILVLISKLIADKLRVGQVVLPWT